MTALSEDRAAFIQDTESGRNQEKLVIWRQRINEQLEELSEFSFENTKKIKLE